MKTGITMELVLASRKKHVPIPGKIKKKGGLKNLTLTQEKERKTRRNMRHEWSI